MAAAARAGAAVRTPRARPAVPGGMVAALSPAVRPRRRAAAAVPHLACSRRTAWQKVRLRGGIVAGMRAPWSRLPRVSVRVLTSMRMGSPMRRCGCTHSVRATQPARLGKPPRRGNVFKAPCHAARGTSARLHAMPHAGTESQPSAVSARGRSAAHECCTTSKAPDAGSGAAWRLTRKVCRSPPPPRFQVLAILRTRALCPAGRSAPAQHADRVRMTFTGSFDSARQTGPVPLRDAPPSSPKPARCPPAPADRAPAPPACPLARGPHALVQLARPCPPARLLPAPAHSAPLPRVEALASPGKTRWRNSRKSGGRSYGTNSFVPLGIL